MRLKIIKTSSYLPSRVITNDFFNDYVDTSDEWITSRTGISTRRFADESNIDMAYNTAKDLVEGIDKSKIHALIVATFTPEKLTPTISNIVHKRLGLAEDVLTFDFNAACSGFVHGLYLAKSMLIQNPDKQVILIGSEKISNYLDLYDRSTCVIFGDAASSVLLGVDDSKDDDVFIFGTSGDEEAITLSVNGKLKMKGSDVFTFACSRVYKMILEVLKKADLSLDEIDHFVCHQANKRIIDHVSKKLKVDKTKFYLNIDRVGNTSSASIGIVLDELYKNKQLKKGDRLICLGFGSGLTWSAALIEV